MNKSISINLGGLSFFIDENAYNKLEKYLNNVRNSLNNENDIEEIIKDIEYRIAELFKEMLGNHREVIEDQDVDKMIGIMGTPEQYSDSENSNNNDNNSEEYINDSSNKESKKARTIKDIFSRDLFRDEDNKVLGGVCAGFANFFGLGISWMRILYILLIIISKGIFIPLYFLLWIAVPKATSVSDKLKMKGKPVNFESIKEFSNINSEEISSIKKQTSNFVEQLLSLVLKCIKLALGVGFIITGISIIIGVIFFNGISWFYNLFSIFFDYNWQMYLFTISIAFILIIPSILFIRSGLSLLGSKYKKSSKTALIVFSSAWVISCIICSILFINFLLPLKNEKLIQTKEYVINSESDTLNISFPYRNNYNRNKIFKEILTSSNNFSIGINKNIEVRKSIDNKIKFETLYTSFDNNFQEINYIPEIIDNNINLNNKFSIINGKYKFQRIKLIVYLPEGKYLRVNNGKLVYTNDMYDRYMCRKEGLFKFKNNILICLNCSNIRGWRKNIDFDDEYNTNEFY